MVQVRIEGGSRLWRIVDVCCYVCAVDDTDGNIEFLGEAERKLVVFPNSMGRNVD